MPTREVSLGTSTADSGANGSEDSSLSEESPSLAASRGRGGWGGSGRCSGFSITSRIWVPTPRPPEAVVTEARPRRTPTKPGEEHRADSFCMSPSATIDNGSQACVPTATSIKSSSPNPRLIPRISRSALRLSSERSMLAPVRCGSLGRARRAGRRGGPTWAVIWPERAWLPMQTDGLQRHVEYSPLPLS